MNIFVVYGVDDYTRIISAFDKEEDAKEFATKLNLLEAEQIKYSNILSDIVDNNTTKDYIEDNEKQFFIEEINKFDCSDECKEVLINELKVCRSWLPSFELKVFYVSEIKLNLSCSERIW